MKIHKIRDKDGIPRRVAVMFFRNLPADVAIRFKEICKSERVTMQGTVTKLLKLYCEDPACVADIYDDTEDYLR